MSSTPKSTSGEMKAAAERRMERALIAEFEQVVGNGLAQLLSQDGRALGIGFG